MSIPELQQNPLVQRVIDIFDTDGNGEIDFKGIESMYATKTNWGRFEEEKTSLKTAEPEAKDCLYWRTKKCIFTSAYYGEYLVAE